MEDLEIDVSNDPEIERLGANATAVYALKFWKQLSAAARKDGQLLDPLWDDATQDKNGAKSAHYTRQLVLTESAAHDHRLYQRFRSNLGNFPVKHIRTTATSNPLVSDIWTSLLLACEGSVPDYNFMTLLREDAHQMFWMREDSACEGLIIVPRAQFLFVELARCREGCYDRIFRQHLQLFDVKTSGDLLQESMLDKNNCSQAERALLQLETEWPCPSLQTLKLTGVVRVLKHAAGKAISESVREKSTRLLQQWQDIHELGRLRTGINGKQEEALHRAGKALTRCQAAATTITDPAKYVTRTTNELSKLISSTDESKKTADIFESYGMVVLTDLVQSVEEYRRQADHCLLRLISEQLEPRGLQVDGEDEFDFKEVRQRPGHRVDNRFGILEPGTPIAALGERLLRELPSQLFPKDKGVKLQLLYAGVVHSFAREEVSDPHPPPQFWHRDGPSLFQGNHHATHCFNVFVPLLDVSSENGTTEFVAGTHEDRRFEEVAADLILFAQSDRTAQHELAVRAEISAGNAVIFDIRVLHRGLANSSMKERPVLYFTIARDWFQEKHMFQNKSIEDGPQDNANQAIVSNLYRIVTGREPGRDKEYGHPHYTTRFDLLLLEKLSSVDKTEQAKAAANVAAVLAFVNQSAGDKDSICRNFVHAFDSEAVERKKRALQEVRQQRHEARQQSEAEDFASMSTDLSDVSVLYHLTARLLLEESSLLSMLGFTADEFGVCTVLALLKAYATHSKLDNVGVSPAQLEESFTSWWHAGSGRFEFLEGHTESRKGRLQRKLLVVFSSLGLGIARPEWRGSIRGAKETLSIDVLHVLDPSFTWYNQDPSCEWKGGDYYMSEIKRLAEGYSGVMFLGDSMGASAALRFCTIADVVLAFTPQVDITHYQAITRKDFPMLVRKDFERKLLSEVSKTRSEITIHYGKDCKEDVLQIEILPRRSNVQLIAHDFDDHILSLHLRDQGVLTDMVKAAVKDFVSKRYR